MVCAIIQARMGSTRLPGKVLKEVCGQPLIGHMIQRVKKARMIDRIILATSVDPVNDPLQKYVSSLGINVFRGSEADVLDRFYQAAKAENADVIVRLTGDCPLIDPVIVDRVIQKYFLEKVDYASNVEPPTFPDGLDTEVFSFKALEDAWKNAKDKSLREHVTLFLRQNQKFSKTNFVNETDLSKERWTVDDIDDLQLVTNIFENLGPHGEMFYIDDVIELNKRQPALFEINSNTKRNGGKDMSTGQKLWSRAKRVIAGGNSLLSKRPDQFLPEAWPCYFDKAKGITVWDLDGNQYIDMSIMGIGTNILGYANDDVDAKVLDAVQKSTGSTLNCPEEVYLAEKLIELHPWAEMVRYSRTGGEACAMAIRIARAASGKDKIAFCGYHGWSDWYLAANLADAANLDGQLLPGLKPKGVPRGLKGTMFPFNFNKIEELESILASNDIGIIIMEPVRRTKVAA